MLPAVAVTRFSSAAIGLPCPLQSFDQSSVQCVSECQPWSLAPSFLCADCCTVQRVAGLQDTVGCGIELSPPVGGVGAASRDMTKALPPFSARKACTAARGGSHGTGTEAGTLVTGGKAALGAPTIVGNESAAADKARVGPREPVESCAAVAAPAGSTAADSTRGPTFDKPSEAAAACNGVKACKPAEPHKNAKPHEAGAMLACSDEAVLLGVLAELKPYEATPSS